jgi:hypothetical protein
MKDLINTCREYTNHIVLSLAPPRRDSIEADNMCNLLNAQLASLYMHDQAVHICNNSNLGNCGVPVQHLYHTDLVHLSSEGQGRLYGNIKRTIKIALGETETQPFYSVDKAATSGRSQQKGKRTNQMNEQYMHEHNPQISNNSECYPQSFNGQKYYPQDYYPQSSKSYNKYDQYPHRYDEHAYDLDRNSQKPTSSRDWMNDYYIQ